MSSNEIKSFLNASSVSYSEGHACYVTTCARHCRKRIKINELDKLFINSTTGTSTSFVTFSLYLFFTFILSDLFTLIIIFSYYINIVN